jgi:hypothetical protein
MRDWYSKNRDDHSARVRSYKSKHRNRLKALRYGIDEQTLIIGLSSKCKICEVVDAEVVDHDHNTGEVRGFLCSNCNKGLGFFKDSPTSLKNAINYLRG